MTNAFVTNEYPTGFSKTGVPCARAIKRLADFCRRARIPVIYTKGISFAHSNHVAERGRWSEKTSTIQKERSKHADTIYHEISPVKGDIVIVKPKPSAFFGTQLIGILNFMGVDTLIVTGMTTSGCVRATVVDAFSYNYRVIVPEECVADRSQISHKVNLFDMNMKYADVMKLEEVLDSLQQLKKPY